MSSAIYDDGFALQFTPHADNQALRSVAINRDGVPELRFDSALHTPSLKEEDVATVCRLVFKGERPNFTYRAIDESHPFYGRQYMVYDPPWLKGTSVGDVLSEVDWKMKCLNVGAQTDKSKKVFYSREMTSVTEGLATLLDFEDDKSSSPGYMFTRCDGVQVQEYDDEMVFYSGPKLRIDYYKSEAYSKYITRVLPLIAEHDEPSFLKLQEIIKMVLAAEWFKEKGIQMSEKWMENCACCKETAMSRTSTDNSDHSQLLCEIKNSISRPRQAVDISMRENEREQSGSKLAGKGINNDAIICYGWYDSGSGEMVQYREDGEWFKEHQLVRTYTEQVVTVNGKRVDSKVWLTNLGILLPNKLRVNDIWKLENNLVAVKEHHDVFTPIGPFTVNIQADRITEERGKKITITAEIQPSVFKHAKCLPCVKITTTVRESTHDWDFVYQGLSPQRPMMPVPEVSDCPQSPDVVSWNELYSQTVPWPRVWISSSEGPGVLSATGGVRTDTIPIERVACCDGSRRPADRYSFVVEARIQGSIETVSSKEVQQLFRKEWTGHEKGTCPQIHGIFAVKNAGLLQKWNRYKDALTNKTVESYFHGTTLKCDIKANNTRLCQFSNCGICGIVNEGFSFEHIKAGGFQRFDRTSYRAQLLCDVCPGNKYVLKKTDQSLAGPPVGCNSVYGQLGLRCWSALRYTGVRSGIRITMSKIEAKTEEEKAAATTGTEETAVSAAIARVVRMGLRPPPRSPANGDWELWVSRFELYVLQANISEGLWTKELLTLLEDEPFRVISRQGLVCSNDYKAVCACLQQHFAPVGNELEWQFKIQNRVQKVGESLLEYSGDLRRMADKVYPSWPHTQRQELLRNQFIQGVRSPTVQLLLMKEVPKTLDEALKLACRQETVESAQKQLHKLKHSEAASAVTPETKGESTICIESVRATGHDERDEKIEALSRQIRQLSEEMEKLRTPRKSGQRPDQGRKDVVCWMCGGHGHIRRNCPNKKEQQYVGSAKGKYGNRGPEAALAISSSIIIWGKVSGRPTKMQLDTGSAVTLIRQDVWEEITSCRELYQLDKAHRPIVVANGDRLDTLGQVVLPLHIGGIVEPFPVLVACQLTQECLIGADFLSHFRCHIDMGMKVLVAGETVVKFEIEKSHTSAAVCHAHFGESVEVPGYSQMQVTVGTNKEHVMTGAVMLEPSTTFMERHGLLVARSISYAHAGRMLVQLLNPSPVPAIVNKHERIGSLYPLDESGDTCAKHTVAGKSVVHEHKADSIMEQMVMSTEGLIDEEKDKLRRLLHVLGSAKWFSSLDLASGYWQVEVCPEDQEKTVFVTPYGLFQFRVMPFGLTNAPATFQRLMEKVLSGLHWTTCLVYLDDILIFSATVEDHLVRLRDVLDRLKNAGLKIKPSKCHLMRKSIKYLGHVVSEHGIKTDPEKTRCVADWPTPSNAHELRQFLGLAGYYRRFVKNFAVIAAPLFHLTENHQAWNWTLQCNAAFFKLKESLVTSPVLAYPVFSIGFVVDTDASGEGLGAVLSQNIEGHDHVISYASRTLNKAERKYCATRREMLALVWAIQHFRAYLYGKRFTVCTDHSSLKWLQSFHEPEGQVARWLETLSEYDFEVLHRPGKKHTNADSLSRMPCSQCRLPPEEDNEDQGCVLAVTDSWMPSWTHEELAAYQRQDPDLKQVIKWLETKTLPKVFPKNASSHVKALWSQCHHLVMQNKILYRQWEDVQGRGLNKTLQLVLPSSLVPAVLEGLHSSLVGGHMGAKKTLDKVRCRFYWVGQRKDITQWCISCPTCCSRKTPIPAPCAPMQLDPVERPLQRVAMDILGPLAETEKGNKYILVIGDYFTKWKEAYPLPNMEAMTVARHLVSEFMCRFGVPEQLHSDQGEKL
eukprot:Em0007g413a